MKRLFLILAILLFCFQILDLNAQTRPEIYTLDNGLTVILDPDQHQSEVFGMVAVNVGAKHDPPTATGLAHYMEHMLFKGTEELGTINWEKEKPHIEEIIRLYDELAATEDEEKRREIQLKINEASLKANEYVINNELWNVLVEMGGTSLNAGTGPDATMYFNSFPPGQIEKWLEIYSHRFINPVFRGFQAELEVVYEEKNMYSDMFFWNLLETFNYNFFKNHPYGQQSIIGSIEHLKNPQLSKMIDFYETYYVANNMALVLVGDFDPEVVKPIIEEKFSGLKSGEVPELQIFEEKPFKGREYVRGKYSPIRLGILGFRTVPKLHPDKLKIEIANGILSNSASSGLLDQLMLDNDLMAAQVIDMPYNDHGASIILFIPKMFRQSLNRAERLIMEQLENLKKGDFDEELVEAIKREKYREFQLSLENYTQRALLYADAFISGEDIDVILSYPERILEITKTDIVEVANKYFGENYLALHSRIGFSQPEKIEKPGYEPVISNIDARSEYVQKLDEMEGFDFEYIPVSFDNDITKLELRPYVNLFVTENPLNDIFGLRIRYKIGNYELPGLKHLATVLYYAGTQDKTPIEFKTEFGQTGCTYWISADDSYFTINITGIEENLPKAVELINEIMQNPDINRTAVRKIWEEERIMRRMEDSEPQAVADALYEFVKFGPKSSYLSRLTSREVRRLKADDMYEMLEKLRNYELEIHFTGKTKPQRVAEIIRKNYSISENLNKGNAPIVKDFEQYSENTVFFVHDKKALQSNIYFFINGKAYDIADRALINAFNVYFGGGFSGIAIQEIREFRSLSYAVSARYVTPELRKKETHFTGYVGTQADKTIEALEVYTDLLINFPEKPERMDLIRNYLIYSGQTLKPSFRGLSNSIISWKNQGYTKDPYLKLEPKYRELDFDNLRDFHAKFIKDRPIVIAIVGDKNRINMEELEKFGKLVEISKKDLYTK